jgi:large subunit ribosomal protein L25
MATAFKLNAKSRTEQGKAYSRRLRRFEGALPAVVYGAGKNPANITVDQNELKTLLNNEAAYSSVLTLNLNSTPEQVVIKDLHRHPWRQEILHIDFLRIKAGEKMTMNVPLHFLNEDTCVGVKAGGSISHLMTTVEVKCLPTALPEAIEVDVANLELDQILHLSDIKLPKGVEFAHEVDGEHNEGIVSVHTNHSAEAEEDAHADEAQTEEAEKTEGAKPSDDKAE